jgi:hypothetical protein
LGTAFIAGSSGGSVAASATVFTSPFGTAQSGTEGNVEQIAPTTMTFGHLECFGPKPTGGTSDVFTVRVNGANVTAATCTVPTGGQTPVSNAITLTLHAGDLFDVQVAQGNSAGNVWWSLGP